MATDHEAELRAAAEDLAKAKSRRERAILAAHAKGGMSFRAIAASVDVSHQRVSQIVQAAMQRR